MRPVHVLIATAAAVATLSACSGDLVEQTSAEPSVPAEAAPTEVVDDPAATADGDVFVYSTFGGCAQMGPNCWTLTFRADGRVDAYREPVDPDEGPEVTAAVDPTLIDAYLAAMPSDVAAFIGQLDEGECRGCVDGVDTIVTLADGTVISSVDHDLDSDIELFAATDALALAAFGVLDLPMESR